MKRAPQKPTRDKPPAPAQAPTPVIESAARLAPEFPSVATLVTVAAAIATPDETPEDTAGRAARLWRACREQVHDIVRAIESEQQMGFMGDALIGERFDFLARCGLSRSNIEIAMRDDNTRVPLVDFLTACKPAPGTKSADMLARWRAYREQGLKRPGMGRNGLLEAVDAQMKSDREQGLALKNVWRWWPEFMWFSFHDRKAKRSEASKKGGRPKKSVGAVKKAGKTPQVKQQRR